MADRPIGTEPIAITGIGCRLPGGVTDRAAAFRLFASGTDAVTAPPADRYVLPARTLSGKPVPAFGGFLDDVAGFDAALFGISAREAESLDPQQRLLLEAAYTALEDARLAPDARAETPTAVYVGMGLVDWSRRTFAAGDPSRLDAWSGTGVFDAVAAGRIAYALGLRGAALAVHTACSSSLVATHLAVRALRAGECDVALAGGVNLLLSPEPTTYFAELGALSPTGRCRTFDAEADGYVRGEGVVLLVLERLSDVRARGGVPLALVLGSAVNQDGRTNGLTAPSGRAQQEVVLAALADASVLPSEIGYVEAHGTGTPLGDPVELAALTEVFRGAGPPLRVSSGKTQIGHLEAAAGAAGLVRAIGALRGRAVPASLHLRTVNPRIRLEGTRLEIPTSSTPWEAAERFAGVSAFGLSGTNAHLVLAAVDDPSAEPEPARPTLITVSAHSRPALDARVAQVRSALAREAPAHVARAASQGRSTHRWRIATVLDDPSQWPTELPPVDGRRRPLLVFAYTGQGSQYAGMGRRLYDQEPVFREALHDVDEAYEPLTGRSIVAAMHGPDDGSLDRTRLTQPAIFALGWALTAWWRHVGVEPDAVMGHSIGELTAAAVAGLWTLPDAVRLVAARAKLLEALPEGGVMVAVHLDVPSVLAVIDPADPRVSVAAINAPDEIVLSGSAAAVEAVLQRMPGVRTTHLSVSHAFHSSLVEPAGVALEQFAENIATTEPKIPIYSCLTGGRAGDEITDPSFWRRHVREPVRFSDTVRSAVSDGHTLFLEIGPRRSLAAGGARTSPESVWLGSLHPERDDRTRMLEAAGALFTRGVPVDFDALHGRGDRAELPPYPFQHERFWIEPTSQVTESRVPTWTLFEAPVPPQSGSVGPTVLQGDADWIGAALNGQGQPTTMELRPGSRVVWCPGRSVPSTIDTARTLASDPRVIALTAVVQGEGPVADALDGWFATVSLEQPGLELRLIRARDVDGSAVVAALAISGEDRLRLAPGGLTATRLRRLQVPPIEPLTLAGVHLITGGTGAFGLQIARWLVDRGVRSLILFSRSGRVADSTALHQLRARGVAIAIATGDVADDAALTQAFEGHELAGVIHAAGTVGETGATLLRTKLDGLRALDRATENHPLQVFIAVSSIAGLWGSASLADYGAANRAMHAVIRERRLRSLPGTAAVFGPLALAGGLVSDEALEAFARLGVRPMDPQQALIALEPHLLRNGDPEPILADIDWNTLIPVLDRRVRRALFNDLRPSAPPPLRASTPSTEPMDRLAQVQAAVALVSGRPGTRPDPDAGFFDLGLDSVMAVELVQRLAATTVRPLPATAAFDHPTCRALAAFLDGDRPAPAPRPRATTVDEPLAIVGMAVRLPGAADLDAYWALLRDGVDAVGPVPADRWDAAAWPDAPTQGGFLTDLTAFDPEAFGLSPREASALDPQQRLVLEVGFEALQDAGIAPSSLEGSRTGVWVGVGRSEYWDRLRRPGLDAYAWSGSGNETSFVSGRLSYVLGARGPSLSVSTACSSSLVALHLATRALRAGEVDLAIVSGVNVLLSPESGTWLTRIGALSPSGRCRTFDAAADGYIRSEGCVTVVLRRTADATDRGDRIWAMVRGSAVGHDGRSGGLTVPSGPAQQDVLTRALRDAGVAATDVTMLEAHGTGTPLGDPIEVGAIRAVYGADRTRPLHVGSVKSNLGHLETAAGLAGLVKAALALHHRHIPRTLHLQTLNPALPTDGQLVFATDTTPWPDAPALAAVSSFGISGTDAHVVLEAAAVPPIAAAFLGPSLLRWSSHSAPGLAAETAALVTALTRHDPADVASMLEHGRTARPLRRFVVGADARGWGGALTEAEAGAVEPGVRVRVGFQITGQGAQHEAMAAALYAGNPRFREALDGVLSSPSLAIDAGAGAGTWRQLLRTLLLEPDPRIHDTTFTQPAMVAFALALAAWWRAHGVTPEVVAGHSVGELAAAAIAGLLEPSDALTLAIGRGAAIGALPRDGSMIAAGAAEDVVSAALTEHPSLSIAAINAPDETVFSGPTDVARAVAKELEARGVRVRELTTSHAFHSRLLDPALPAVTAVAAALPHAEGRIGLIENGTGSETRSRAPGAWAEHARAPVRWLTTIRALTDRCDVILELGPRGVLTALGARVNPEFSFVASLGGADPVSALLEAAGRLWIAGVPVGPIGPRRRPIQMAPAAWDRRRCWVEPAAEGEAATSPADLAALTEADPTTEESPAIAPGAIAVHWQRALPGPNASPIATIAPRSTVEAIALLREHLDRGAAGPLRVVTRGAVATRTDHAVDPDATAIWGLCASVSLEHPELALQLVDLDDAAPAVVPDEPRVAIRDGVAWVPRLGPAGDGAPLQVRADRSYLVTGGTGALGRRMVRWLLDRGAGYVWVVGRNPPSAAVAATFGPERWAFLPADLSRRPHAQVVAERIGAAEPPLDGVIHAAGVAAGGFSLTGARDPSVLPAVWGPKVDGARHLDTFLPPVSWWLVFSSAIGWFGLPGQGAYGAANAWLEGFVARRRAAGGQGTAIAWGPWAGEGMAEDQAFEREGLRRLPVERALAELDRAGGGPNPRIAIDVDSARFTRRWPGGPPPWISAPTASRADPRFPGASPPSGDTAAARALREAPPPARLPLAIQHVGAAVAQVLGRSEPLPARQGFFDAGLDSMMAVELARRLSRTFGALVPPTAVFDHPDVTALATHLLRWLQPTDDAPEAATQIASPDEPVAIVAMACRFPGADTPEAFWDLLTAGRVTVGPVPPERWDADTWADRIYARVGAFLSDIDQFDPDFFGISAREASSLDPQQRLLLEVAWQALERAGRTDRTLRGSRTGVFVGVSDRGYLHRFHKPGASLYPDAWAGTGAVPSFAAGRVAYAFGLHGPAIAVDTTCSSSLVAVHLAARALRAGECDSALAGGVSLMLLPDDTEYLCKINALSRAGRCYTFDARADGYVRGEGCGVVVLRRLSDAVRDGDRVLAVLRGSAMNHDGASAGLTVPNGVAQERVLSDALAASGAAANQIGYLEAHGTGTPLGDPIEVRAISTVYGERSGAAPLLLGAVKANIGHLELAAGVAGLIKAVLVLQHRSVPPTPGLRELNPALELRGAEVPTEQTPLADGAWAAVSAFGLSGTNTHLILERGRDPAPPPVDERPIHLLALSAPSAGSVIALGRVLAGGLPLPAMAPALHARAPGPARAAVVAANAEEAAALLRAVRPRTTGRPPRIALLYSGQGSQFAGMGLDLERSTVLQTALDRCAATLDPKLGRPLRDLLADPVALDLTEFAQPALLAVQWSTTQLILSLGVVPVAVAGHSLGELTAATVAGLWSIEDALALAVARGRRMAALARPGLMVALTSTEAAVRDRLEPGAEIAAVNAVDEVVIAGEAAAVEATLLKLPGIEARRLAVSRPFHSACVDPMLPAWEADVASTPTGALSIPLVSLLTAQVETDALRQSPFWRRHAREPVAALAALRALRGLDVDTFLDVGAHPTLLGLARRAFEGEAGLTFAATARRDLAPWRGVCGAVGALFEAGFDPDWSAWHGPMPRPHAALPTTPFDRRRFWLTEPVGRPADRERAVAWISDPHPDQRLPNDVRLLGASPEVDGLLRSARVKVKPKSKLALDVSLLDGPTDLQARVLALVDVARRHDGPLIVCIRQGASPVALHAATWGAARALQLERPGLRILDLGEPSDLLAGLKSLEDQARVRDGVRTVPRLVHQPLPTKAPPISGTWWITGGLGSIGAHVARGLAIRGVEQLVLISRTRLQADDDPRQAVVSSLREQGIDVVVAPVDVTDEEAMRGVFDAFPPDGVVHAAGVTRPQTWTAIDAATVRETLHAKVGGARVLDRVLGAVPLVLIGSVAATWGSRDLVAYAAANAYLDGLATDRRARGLPTVSVAFGPWADSTMVDAARAERLERSGLRLIGPSTGVDALLRALASDQAQVVVASLDVPRFVSAMSSHGERPLFSQLVAAQAQTPTAGADLPMGTVAEQETAIRPELERQIREVLRLPAERPLPADTPLSEFGFDSLMATELKSTLLARGLDVPLGRLLGGPSIEELATMVVARRSQRAPVAEATGADRTLIWTHLAALLVGLAIASGVWVWLN